ncbi:membrane-bound PQQ-dependent dehydrogenase, glucose/quinate/shikimate family, partial [Klebsiella pneumoniae]|nr:membrane-bound PQQ-dependent dehydrogenase, glucose/quinate/shikimate family [Klebsiella pneumoniae]
DDTLSAEEKASPALQQCPQRIMVSTVDARLLALNAKTGELCADFGDHGSVDLKQGMGDTENSKRYHPTSTPVIMGHIAVLGGWVRDIVH